MPNENEYDVTKPTPPEVLAQWQAETRRELLIDWLRRRHGIDVAELRRESGLTDEIEEIPWPGDDDD